jgi:UDP-glucuronate 4-epimerase
MEIMVTGAAGFIGRNLVPILSEKYDRIYAIDNLNSLLYSSQIKKNNFKHIAGIKNVQCIEDDTNKIKRKGILKNIECIINLAALPGQSLSWENTEQYIKNNTQNVNNLIREFCMEEGAYFLQASTSSVYGKVAIGGNNAILKPNNPYGVTKLAAENLIEAYAQNYEFDYSILRLFSVYGPHQRPDMGVYKFLNAIMKGLDVTIYGDGSQSRSLTYVVDVVTSIMKTVELKPSKEILDISGDKVMNVNEIVSICEKVIGNKANIKFVKTPVGDQEKTIGNFGYAKKIIGVEKYTAIEFGIHQQFKQMLEIL